MKEYLARCKMYSQDTQRVPCMCRMVSSSELMGESTIRMYTTQQI